MEEQLLKRRISTPRAATVIVLAAVVAFAATVAPSLAGSFLTNQKAAKLYLSNRKRPRSTSATRRRRTLYLKKKAASNIYVAKATAPQAPVAGDCRRHRAVRSDHRDHRRLHPVGVHLVRDQGERQQRRDHVLGRRGPASRRKRHADQACPVQILVDGQSTGKVNFAPATTSPAERRGRGGPARSCRPRVLTKGGHTVSVQYAGAARRRRSR